MRCGTIRLRILWQEGRGRGHHLHHQIGHGKQARGCQTCISVLQKGGAFGHRDSYRTIWPAFQTLLPSASSVGASHLKVKVFLSEMPNQDLLSLCLSLSASINLVFSLAECVSGCQILQILFWFLEPFSFLPTSGAARAPLRHPFTAGLLTCSGNCVP